MNIKRLGLLLFLSLAVSVSLAQPIIQLNNNLKLSVKVLSKNSKYFIIPSLKVLSDTQDIQIHKEITYGNERNPIVDCRFYLKKVIKKQFVNMYVSHSYNPDLDSPQLRKFTTKDLLNDSIMIENFIDLEPGYYLISLEFKYYLNGEESYVYSGESSFFVGLSHPLNSFKKKKYNSTQSK